MERGEFGGHGSCCAGLCVRTALWGTESVGNRLGGASGSGFAAYDHRLRAVSVGAYGIGGRTLGAGGAGGALIGVDRLPPGFDVEARLQDFLRQNLRDEGSGAGRGPAAPAGFGRQAPRPASRGREFGIGVPGRRFGALALRFGGGFVGFVVRKLADPLGGFPVSLARPGRRADGRNRHQTSRVGQRGERQT